MLSHQKPIMAWKNWVVLNITVIEGSVENTLKHFNSLLENCLPDGHLSLYGMAQRIFGML